MARSFDGVLCALACRVLYLSTRMILHNHGWEEYVYDVERRLPANLGAVPRTTWKAKLVRFPLLRLMLRACTNMRERDHFRNQMGTNKIPVLPQQNAVCSKWRPGQ
jgi:hypothetical protein